MKKFLKCLWGGLVSTLTLLLLALVIWAFLTLAVVVVVVFSPVLFVLFVHLSYKATSFIDFVLIVKEVIAELEKEKDDEEN